MRTRTPRSQARRRSVFRIRPSTAQPPVGHRAYQSHGQAVLGGQRVCSGDLLCVDSQRRDGVEVFEPLSPGHPMLGHRPDGELRSLPADVPCSSSVWAPAGAVVAVLRSVASARVGEGVACLPQPAAAPGRRALCLRLPQAALALVRSERPELMGRRPAQRDQRDGVLVFPGAAASAQALGELAAQLAALLGPGATVEQASSDELRITAWRALDLTSATQLLRSLGRRIRIPLSLAVADDLHSARQLAGSLEQDQLLFALAAGPSRRGAAALPAQVQGWPWPMDTMDAPVHRAASRPAPGQPGAVQLGLFDQAHAA
jgi:hypothetical protein